MPNLKQLTCNVEWEGPATALQEFQTTYGDGYVETFIAVPDVPNPFSIHLQSHDYVAPGLSMFVYMDGVYQCNRNRRNLRVQGETDKKHRTEIDFRVRQKEQLLWDGTFTGRPWHFTKLNIGAFLVLDIELMATNSVRTAHGSNANADEIAPHNGEHVGTIEVVVLRCEAPDRTTKSFRSATKLVNLKVPSDKRPVQDSSKGASKSNKSSLSKTNQKKSKQQRQAKTKAKRHNFGLDGSSDDPGPPAPHTGQQTNTQNGSWDNRTFPVATAKNENSKDWDNWKMPTPKVETSDDKGWSNGDNPPLAEDGPGKGASEAVYHPVNTSHKAGSDSGSQAGSQGGRKQSGSQKWSNQEPQKGPQRDPSDRNWNGNGEQSTDPVHLRGGGRSTQSITSRRSAGRDSPLVVNNSIVYNGVGTPPPLSSGPPAAREFWNKMDGNGLVNAASKAIRKPAAAADPWGSVPKSDANKKVDDWNTGESGMPGAWDAVGNDPQKDNGAASDWNQPQNDTQGNHTDWNNSNDQQEANGGDWQTTGEQNDTTTASQYNEDANASGWDTGNTSTEPNNDAWNADNSHVAQETSVEEPQAFNNTTEEQTSYPISSQGFNGKPGGKKGRGKRPATGNKQKGKGSMFNWLNPYATQASEQPESPDSPPPSNKAPSPTTTMNPPSPQWNKRASPTAVEATAAGSGTQAQAQAQPSFTISSRYEAKSYWSNWRDRKTLEETSINDEGLMQVEGPQYAIPNDLVERKKMSHQIRPSVPARYSHKVSRPKYIDSFDKPYAVFVFQYRDKDIIEEILNTSVIESEADEKQRLSSLPKSQLIEELMKAKSQGSSNGASGSRHSSDKATFKSNPFNVPLSPNVSALTQRLSTLESSKPPTPEKVGGWLETASGNGNGNGNGDSAWNKTTSPKTKENWGESSQKGSDAGKTGGGTSAWDWKSWGGTSQKGDDKASSSAWNNKETTAASTDKKEDVPDTALDWNNPEPTATAAADEETHDNAAPNSGWDVAEEPHNDNTAVGDAWDTNNDNNHNDSTWNNDNDNNDGKTDNTNKEDTTWGTSGFGGMDTAW